jgi:hypothetical protein
LVSDLFPVGIVRLVAFCSPPCNGASRISDAVQRHQDNKPRNLESSPKQRILAVTCNATSSCEFGGPLPPRTGPGVRATCGIEAPGRSRIREGHCGALRSTTQLLKTARLLCQPRATLSRVSQSGPEPPRSQRTANLRPEVSSSVRTGNRLPVSARSANRHTPRPCQRFPFAGPSTACRAATGTENRTISFCCSAS